MEDKNTTAFDDEVYALLEGDDLDDTDDVEEDDFEDEIDDNEEDDYDDDGDDEEGDDEDYEDDDDDDDDDGEEDDEEEVEVYNIPGLGEVTREQLIEYKNGYLRQSDYTKKTTEVANKRKEAEKALEVFNMLQQNPQLRTQLVQQGYNRDIIEQANPDKIMLETVVRQQREMEVDNTIRDLKSRYGDFDENILFNRAVETNTKDLEVVLQSLLYNTTSETQVDTEAIKEQLRKEILKDIQNTKRKVATTITTRQKPIAKDAVSLTDEEKRIADGMNMSYKDYAKWK